MQIKLGSGAEEDKFPKDDPVSESSNSIVATDDETAKESLNSSNENNNKNVKIHSADVSTSTDEPYIFARHQYYKH